MGIPDHLNLPHEKAAGQEATERTGDGTTDWFQIEKGVCQGCISSPCLFNLYAEGIMRNAGLEKAQEFQKNTYFCFIDYTKDFDSVDHNKLRKILKEKRIPDHLACLLRNVSGSRSNS